MLSVLITRDMCNERKKCTHSTHHRAGPGSSSHIVTILAADLRPSDTQISYIQQMYLFQSVFLVGLEVHTDWVREAVKKKKIADLRTYAELWGGGVQPNPN